MVYHLKPLAAEDLDRILDYSIEQFPAQAARTSQELLDAFKRLAENPTYGNPRDDLFPGCRTWMVRVFVIIYREVEDGVEVVRIAHGRQLLEGLVLGEDG